MITIDLEYICINSEYYKESVICKRCRYILNKSEKNQFKEYFLNEEAVYSSNKIFVI